MHLNFLIPLSLAGWISCVKSEKDFDCTGSVTGVCRSPADCKEEFTNRCMSEAVDDKGREADARCCPDPLRMLTEDDFSDRRALCWDRKCLGYYNGWWSRSCVPPSRTLYVCPRTGRYCCGAICRIRPKCLSLGGHCVSNRKRCDGQVYRRLCRGYRCFCCVPAVSEGNHNTTTVIAITPSSSLSSGSVTTTISSSIDNSSVTVISSNSNSITLTFPTPSNPSTLVPCEITGVSIHTPCSGPRHCNQSGVQMICPYSNCPPVKAHCTDDGYMIVLYRNMLQHSCNFSRTWDEYKQGFCDAEAGEYWLGNEVLYALTKDGPIKMKMVGTDFTGYTTSIYYEGFQVLDEANKYRAAVTGFNNTASNGINLFYSTPSNNTIMHGMNFSTYDQDNDAKEGSCSNETEYGGWWFNGCTNIKATRNSQIDWYFWTPPAYTQSLMRELLFAVKPTP